MPAVFLAPSAEVTNNSTPGGIESLWMGRLAHRLTDLLRRAGISCTRALPGTTTDAAIRQSNEGNYDLHLVLRTRAAPEGGVAPVRGVVIFHQPNSPKGRRAAARLAAHLGRCYPLPEAVTTQDTAAGVLTRVRAPCVLLQPGCLEHPDDAAWLSQRLPSIAAAIAEALAEYFGLPPISPDSVTDFL